MQEQLRLQPKNLVLARLLFVETQLWHSHQSSHLLLAWPSKPHLRLLSSLWLVRIFVVFLEHSSASTLRSSESAVLPSLATQYDFGTALLVRPVLVPSILPVSSVRHRPWDLVMRDERQRHFLGSVVLLLYAHSTLVW